MMRLLEAILLALSIAAVQAKAIDTDETRFGIKRQFTPTNSTDGASCVGETVTETLRETVTAKDPVAVTIAASSAGGDVNANKFEGLRLSTITETETVFATGVAETITVLGVGSTVTHMLTVVAEALPVAFTVTEIVTEAVSAPIFTVTETLTIAGEAVAPVTITETVGGTCKPSVTYPLPYSMTDSNSPQAASTVQDAPVAQSSSVTPVGLPKGNGVGVSTVPIPESALPTTTFAVDPLAPSSQTFPEISSSSSAVTDTPAVTSKVRSEPSSPTTAPSPAVETPDVSKSGTTSLGDVISTSASSVAEPSPTTESASSELVQDTTLVTESSAMTSGSVSDPAPATDVVSEPTAAESSSVEDATASGTSLADDATTTPTSSIGNTAATLLSSLKDTTTTTGTSLVQDPQAISGGALILPQINISTLTLSSALELGNLMGLVVTATPTVAAQAEVYPTQRVSSMTLKMLG